MLPTVSHCTANDISHNGVLCSELIISQSSSVEYLPGERKTVQAIVALGICSVSANSFAFHMYGFVKAAILAAKRAVCLLPRFDFAPFKCDSSFEMTSAWRLPEVPNSRRLVGMVNWPFGFPQQLLRLYASLSSPQV